MKRLVLVLIISLTFLATNVSADEWETLINDSLKQRPSKRKRKTSSGRRLLREKARRINDIDNEIPFLLSQGDYGQAEEFLKEALKLTIELYDLVDIHVAEKFMSLGILYMEAGKPDKAVRVFSFALEIGEALLGQDSYQLANIYKFLSIAYYQIGQYGNAESVAERFLSANVNQFGPNSPQVIEAKDFLRQIYSRGR